MAEERPGRLLNPFAFPSETELRSVLLIWAILGLCWEMGFFFTGVVASSVGWPAPNELPNLERDVWGIQASAEGLPWPAALAQKEKALAEKLAVLSQPEERDRTKAALDRLSKAAYRQLVVTLPYLFIPLIFLLLTLLVIWGYYFARARRLWFVHLAEKHQGSAGFRDSLDSLVEEAQALQGDLGEKELPRPKFLVSRGARGDGQVYGTSRRPLIVLSRGVPLLLRKEIRSHGKPYSIRALLFHELAHLANRDITRSYLAEVSWVVLIPVLALLIPALWLTWFSVGGIDDPRQHPIVVSLQVLGTLLVIEIIRRGLLRGREHFADLRAGVLWQVGDPLRAVLQRDPDVSVRPNTLLRSFARLWQKHPALEERREILDNPSLVFGIRHDAAFLAGLLFGSLLVVAILLTSLLVIAADAAAVLAISNLAQKYAEEKGLVYAMQFYYRTGLFLWSLSSFVVTYALPAMAIYLLAGTLGVQAQRESVLQVVEGRLHPHPYRALRKPAFLAAVGFEAGLTLVPLGPALPGSPGSVLGALLWVSYATLLLWLWLATIRFFARRILGRHVAARKPSRPVKWMTLGSAILLVPLTLALLGAQVWIWSATVSATGWTALGSGVLGLLSFIFLLVLMLFALAIWQASREGARGPRCPSCKADPGGTTVADRCAACGRNLAPWLLVAARTGEEGSSA